MYVGTRLVVPALQRWRQTNQEFQDKVGKMVQQVKVTLKQSWWPEFTLCHSLAFLSSL